MKNVNALQLQGIGQLVDIIEQPDDGGKMLKIIWRSIDCLFKHEVILMCACHDTCKVPQFLLEKALHVSQSVIVSFTAEVMDITAMYYGQTPECPNTTLHMLVQLTTLKFIGVAEPLQASNETLRLAA